MLLCQNHELIPPKSHDTYWPPLFVFIFKPQHSTLHTSTPTTDLINLAPFNKGLTIRSFLTQMWEDHFSLLGDALNQNRKTPFPLTAWLVYLQLTYLTSYLLRAVMIEHDWTRLAIFDYPFGIMLHRTATHSDSTYIFTISILPYTVLTHSFANHWNPWGF